MTNQPVPFGQPGEDGVVPAFRPRAGTAFYGSLTALYHLGGRYSLLAEPFLKSYPQSFTRPEYALSQTYWMSGVQLGLRVRL